MSLEKRIAQLENGDRSDMVCPACAATGEEFRAWCVHRLPPPFDYFVALKMKALARAAEREQQQNRKDPDGQPFQAP